MAVPKKKTSRSKRNSRRSSWNKKVLKNFTFAVSLGKSLISNNKGNFIFESSLDF